DSEYRLAMPSREILRPSMFRQAERTHAAARPLADEREHPYRHVMSPQRVYGPAGAVLHTAVTRHVSETTTKKITEQFLRRVVYARKRIEERPHVADVVMKHRASIAVQPAAIAVDTQPAGPRRNARTASEPASLTNADIHRLTERVLR